eukprot:6105668-Amphidinium_carterae.1
MSRRTGNKHNYSDYPYNTRGSGYRPVDTGDDASTPAAPAPKERGASSGAPSTHPISAPPMPSPFGGASCTGSSASIFGAPATAPAAPASSFGAQQVPMVASIFGAPVEAPPPAKAGVKQVPVGASPFGAPTTTQAPSMVAAAKAGPGAPPPGVTSKAPSTTRSIPLRYLYAPTLDELTLAMSRLSADEGVHLLDNTLVELVRGLDVASPGECFRRLVTTTTVVKRVRLCTN